LSARPLRYRALALDELQELGGRGEDGGAGAENRADTGSFERDAL
jgi:hypothetical protein